MEASNRNRLGGRGRNRTPPAGPEAATASQFCLSPIACVDQFVPVQAPAAANITTHVILTCIFIVTSSVTEAQTWIHATIVARALSCDHATKLLTESVYYRRTISIRPFQGSQMALQSASPSSQSEHP
jgi:hypothetical protein